MKLISKDNMSLMQREDGYVNATALCRSVGKEWKEYSRLKSTKEFIGELSRGGESYTTDLIQIRKGGIPTEQGTYIHPKVAIHLGQWLSPKFAVFVSNVVFDFMNNTPQSEREEQIKIDPIKASKRYKQITKQMMEMAEGMLALQEEGNIIYAELLKENTLLKLR